jgi:hypothetical protein
MILWAGWVVLNIHPATYAVMAESKEQKTPVADQEIDAFLMGIIDDHGGVAGYLKTTPSTLEHALDAARKIVVADHWVRKVAAPAKYVIVFVKVAGTLNQLYSVVATAAGNAKLAHKDILMFASAFISTDAPIAGGVHIGLDPAATGPLAWIADDTTTFIDTVKPMLGTSDLELKEHKVTMEVLPPAVCETHFTTDPPEKVGWEKLMSELSAAPPPPSAKSSAALLVGQRAKGNDIDLVVFLNTAHVDPADLSAACRLATELLHLQMIPVLLLNVCVPAGGSTARVIHPVLVTWDGNPITIDADGLRLLSNTLVYGTADEPTTESMLITQDNDAGIISFSNLSPEAAGQMKQAVLGAASAQDLTLSPPICMYAVPKPA